MKRRTNLYFAALLLLLTGLYMVVQLNAGKKSDPAYWLPSFSKYSRKPYGAEALFVLLPDLFKAEIITIGQPVYEQMEPWDAVFDWDQFLRPNVYGKEDDKASDDHARYAHEDTLWAYDTLAYDEEEAYGASEQDESVETEAYDQISLSGADAPIAYIAVGEELNLDEFESERLMNFIREGNYAFLAAHDFGKLGEKLDIELRQPMGRLAKEDSVESGFYVSQTGPAFGYNFSRPNLRGFFTKTGPPGSLALAYNNEERVNLIAIPVGSGRLILSATPYIFTNYHTLKEEQEGFITGALSYLPADAILWWDEHYKPENLHKLAEGRDDLLSYVRSQPMLHGAWRILVWGIVLFLLLEIKRRRRAIRVITPPSNASLDFVETVGMLYFQRQDHLKIAEKRIRFLNDYIRNRFLMKQTGWDNTFVEQLTAKSGCEPDTLKELAILIRRTKRNSGLTESTLIELNTRIEQFYRESGRYATAESAEG